MGCINLADCISKEVTRVARDLCARPNTMELKLKRSCGTEVKYVINKITINKMQLNSQELI